MQQTRRALLALAASTGSVALAGCSGDDGNSEDETGDDSGEQTADGADDTGDDGGGTDTGNGEAETGDDGGEETGNEGEGSVSLSLELAPGTTAQFDSLVVEFGGFEYRREGEVVVSRPGTGERFDLSNNETVTLTETNVPAGSYTDAAAYLPVVEYEASDGSTGEFSNTDPSVVELDSFDEYRLEEGASLRLQLTVSVFTDNQNGGWRFSTGYVQFPSF
jgi:hypothetical protein